MWKSWIVTLVYLVRLKPCKHYQFHILLLILVKPKWNWWKKALSICNPIRWSGVLCVLDLSSVFFVQCFYKSYEVMLKYKIMFNELIKPRKCPSFNSNIVYFLFCSNTLRVPIFAIFANFGQFRKIKYPRNLYRDGIRKNLYPRKKVWHFKFQ